VVLSIRKGAESQDALAAALDRWKEAENKLEDAIKWRVKRIAKAVTGDKTDWRERARLMQQGVDLCISQTRRPRPDQEQRVIDRDGSLKRQWFSARLSEYLHLGTGKWCDVEVATLTEIAFPGKDVTIDMVRKARKNHNRRG
jgi:hypothetical protein